MSTSTLNAGPGSACALEHGLAPYLPEFARYPSFGRLERSPLYRKLRPEIERVLGSVVFENLSSGGHELGDSIRATAWNIERGIQLPGILRALEEHARLQDSDLLLLTELDFGMARTQNRFVAREMALHLNLNYAFAPCYLALNKGSGLESRLPGKNTYALHGNALLSRYPLRGVHSLALPNGKDKMRGNEKRLGCQKAVIADIDHPAGRFRAVALHLDAHATQKHRRDQMRLLLDHLETLSPSLPVVIGGDWNTSTYNSRRALYSILGYARRVLMGIRNVLENHYPYPDRWFERHLFRELLRRGYRYLELNEPGGCTLHYDVNDLAINENMGEWIPQWCFWFINWALKRAGGRCSMKLDWFAGKGIAPDPSFPPAVAPGLNDGGLRLSDHDPIVLDFRLGESV